MVGLGLGTVLLLFSFGPSWLFLLMQQSFMYNHNRFICKEKCQFHSVICLKFTADILK